MYVRHASTSRKRCRKVSRTSSSNVYFSTPAMAWRHHRNNRRTLKILACLSIALFLLHSFGYLDFSTRRYDTWPWTTCSGSPFQASCVAPRASIAKDVMVVVKTGGSEPQDRLRYQLATILTEVPDENVVIFSDLEEQVGSYSVRDVYADVKEEERKGYPEFKLYDLLKEYQRMGRDTRELQGGWDLAKYMNLAMTRKLWSMMQQDGHIAQKKWFIFIDTDTFIESDNLLELLTHHDPIKNIYLGSPVWLPGLPFAHGGSAYVLSSGAMKTLNTPDSHDTDGRFWSQYGINVTELCCGDEAIAKVLKRKGVKLKGYWPMFNGEIPATVPFGKELWCEPVVSQHHIGGKDMERFWEWVENWKVETMNADWDSIDDSMKIYPKSNQASSSFEHCETACKQDESCFQFVYDGACAFSHQIRLGRERLLEKNGKRYISGWNMQRIRAWTMDKNCESAHWVRSNP